MPSASRTFATGAGEIVGRSYRTTPARVGIEPLEGRTLLSWPVAPFAAGSIQATLYVNQFGDASLSSRTLERAGQFDAYQIYFDEGGTMNVTAKGTIPVRSAVYLGAGPPAKASSSDNGSVPVTVPADRRTCYIGVRAAKRQTGRYNLRVDGPPEGVIESVLVSKKANAGSTGSNIPQANDFDFFSFKTTRRGVWSVQVIPQAGFDVTMNVYDAAGQPIGGKFIRPIDSAGRGGTELWVSHSLAAGQKIFVRVDGKGKTTGGYNVFVHAGAQTKAVRNAPFTVSSIAPSSAPAAARSAATSTSVITRLTRILPEDGAESVL